MISDAMLHAILSQISELQNKVDALEERVGKNEAWPGSVQSALVRAADEYERLDMDIQRIHQVVDED